VTRKSQIPRVLVSGHALNVHTENNRSGKFRFLPYRRILSLENVFAQMSIAPSVSAASLKQLMNDEPLRGLHPTVSDTVNRQIRVARMGEIADQERENVTKN
jgi:hypothetical protein